jgi:hypothetical protein
MENKQTEFKSARGLARHSFGRVVCLGAVILTCSSALAQNLFVAASADGRDGLAVLDSGKRLGLARYHHYARGVGCADTGSGCAVRRDLELRHGLG